MNASLNGEEFIDVKSGDEIVIKNNTLSFSDENFYQAHLDTHFKESADLYEPSTLYFYDGINTRSINADYIGCTIMRENRTIGLSRFGTKDIILIGRDSVQTIDVPISNGFNFAFVSGVLNSGGVVSNFTSGFKDKDRPITTFSMHKDEDIYIIDYFFQDSFIHDPKIGVVNSLEVLYDNISFNISAMCDVSSSVSIISEYGDSIYVYSGQTISNSSLLIPKGKYNIMFHGDGIVDFKISREVTEVSFSIRDSSYDKSELFKNGMEAKLVSREVL